MKLVEKARRYISFEVIVKRKYEEEIKRKCPQDGTITLQLEMSPLPL